LEQCIHISDGMQKHTEWISAKPLKEIDQPQSSPQIPGLARIGKRQGALTVLGRGFQ
jgi:hypothetical protein